ncbi:MAG: PspC domain-containing protein [Bacteroidales bacterium]|nr:PspC domain-containing protein [Bacteroidales bacterium]
MSDKRLYRSSSNTVIAGVSGGLGDYFNIDPVIFRILFVLAAVFGGGGVIIYIVLWIVIPQQPVFQNGQFGDPGNNQNENNSEESSTENPDPVDMSTENKEKKRNDSSLWGGIILIALGAIFLADRYWPHIDFDDFWPVILIAVGVILIFKSTQQIKDKSS